MTDFRPDQNLVLQALRAAWPDRDEQDRPDFLVHAVGDDGSVAVKPLTFDDIVAWCERRMEGEAE